MICVAHVQTVVQREMGPNVQVAVIIFKIPNYLVYEIMLYSIKSGCPLMTLLHG